MERLSSLRETKEGLVLEQSEVYEKVGKNVSKKLHSLSVNVCFAKKNTVGYRNFPTLTVFETCYLVKNIDIHELIWRN